MTPYVSRCRCIIYICIWTALVALAVSSTLYVDKLELERFEEIATVNGIDISAASIFPWHLIELIIGYLSLWFIGSAILYSFMKTCGDCMRHQKLGKQRAKRALGMAHEELEATCQDLELKNAELERFVYTVSHDLKSPLVTIKGYIGLLLDELEEDQVGEARLHAGVVIKAAEKMQQLLEELLRLSRIGRVNGNYVCVLLNEIVSEVITTTNGISGGVIFDIQDGMPRICGDSLRLAELMQNLIENAIKYSGEQKHPRVVITAWVEDKETICCVEDNGIGIGQAYQDKIFDLFEKLNPDTPGSGVGLAVAKRIVEVHHGRIWCESDGPGHGSRFLFAIPEGEDCGSTRCSTCGGQPRPCIPHPPRVETPRD